MEWTASLAELTQPCDTVGHVGYCWLPRINLFHGGQLENVRLCYEWTGQPQGEVVVVLGGISASRHACTTPLDTRPGWWESAVGPDRAIDTNRYRVLSFDYLGGNGDSTGPLAHQTSFPTISTNDQADCLAHILDHLGFEQIHALVGASYGGMVGLAFAARHPQRINRLTVVSAGNRTVPMATAWRSVQRGIIKLGLEFGATKEAVCLSRALAMTTYRSANEFEERFSGEARPSENGFVFPVEDYLLSRGADFAGRFNPRAFLCLSESIDLHQVDLTCVATRTTLVSVISDQLVPPQLMRIMADQLGAQAQLIEIDSLYGHDAFLKEIDQLTPILAQSLLSAVGIC